MVQISKVVFSFPLLNSQKENKRIYAGCFPSFSSLFLNGDGETACFPLSEAPSGAAPSVFACCVRRALRYRCRRLHISEPSAHTMYLSPTFFYHHYFFLRPDEISQALLNGFGAPAPPSEPSVRATGSGTFIQLRPQGWTRFKCSLC